MSTVAVGLETPWAMLVAPDRRVWVTERGGRIRVIDADGLRSAPWAELPVAHVGESGLLGIALAPDFETSGAVYVAGVYAARGRTLPMRIWRRGLRAVGIDAGTDFVLRVHRLMDRGGRGEEPVVVVDGIPASALHPGGVIRFVSDSMFLLSVGDSMDPWKAQDGRDPRGSILAVRVPASRDVVRFGAGATALASGVRNPQGIVRLGATETWVFIDHGPTGTAVEGHRAGRDELNVLKRGANYGWPVESGVHHPATFERPIHEWTEAIAPAGLAVLPSAGGTHAASVFVTGLRGQSLRRLELVHDAASAWQVRCEASVVSRSYGRLRAIAAHPDGGLLVATSNRDSRGAPGQDDDRVLWLRPAGSP